MSNVHDISDQLNEIRRSLQNGGGGGTFDPMEERVRQLESDMSFIKGKLDDMPTKDWMNTRLLAYAGVSVAVIGIMIKFL
ncbi:hypothetical protein [Thioclava sp. NG1]|uniref:hypothetical protein n=1 Tax=Thioclava sp. NG1 TaxID=2182426 RepID=UPI0011B28D47|nr:hypothetical protein [Thioclava sp. NG1]